MKKAIVLMAMLLVVSVCGFANTTYNNFTGNSDWWHPLGYPNTATYGELFTAPTNGDDTLTTLTFYIGDPFNTGDIWMKAYLATWTGTDAGTLVGSSNPFDYANTGFAPLSFNAYVPSLTPGASYVLFLSISEVYGQSSGSAYIVPGSNTIPGGGFVYNNNAGDFNALFNTQWSGPLSPQWAMDIEFGPSTPEPGTLLLLGSGLLGGLGMIRRKLF